MPGRQPPELFCDQGAKLRYLIERHGDRRPRSAGNPGLIKDERVTRNGADYPAPIVVNQVTLAEALAVDPARVSDWMGKRRSVPPRDLAEICRIFAIDETAFRILSIDDFIASCEAADRRGLQMTERGPGWRSLLRKRTAPGLRLLRTDPHGDPFAPTTEPDLRYARVKTAQEVPPLPDVRCGVPFWLALASPQAPDGGWTWSGWSLLLLNHDRRQGGFACLLSPWHGLEAFGGAQFPKGRRSLYLPAGQGLQHEAPDDGAFDLISVVSRAPPPEPISRGLALADAHGPEIEPALQALAAWIEAEPAEVTAIVGLTYRVVPATSDPPPADASRGDPRAGLTPAKGRPGR